MTLTAAITTSVAIPTLPALTVGDSTRLLLFFDQLSIRLHPYRYARPLFNDIEYHPTGTLLVSLTGGKKAHSWDGRRGGSRNRVIGRGVRACLGCDTTPNDWKLGRTEHILSSSTTQIYIVVLFVTRVCRFDIWDFCNVLYLLPLLVLFFRLLSFIFVLFA